MNIKSFVLISFLIASGLSYYQYFYKAKIKSKVHLLLAFLRFFTVFGVLLLLINPIISRNTFEIVKTPLAIAVDNSGSIVDLKASETSLEVYKKITSNAEIQEKFDVQSYRFDSDFQSLPANNVARETCLENQFLNYRRTRV